MTASDAELRKLGLRLSKVKVELDAVLDRVDRLTEPELPVVSPHGFAFGARSLRELVGGGPTPLHPSLRAVAHLALCYSEVDFGCTSGYRTLAKQQQFMDAGTSWVRRPEDSLHTSGHAIDLVPWVDGQYTWEDVGAFEQVAFAVWSAARELVVGYQLDHGYVLWEKDRPHWQLTSRPGFADTTPAVTAYLERL